MNDISGNLAGDLIMELHESLELPDPKQYEVEDLLEMLGGDQYYSMDKIMYVYHELRGEIEEASHYQDLVNKTEIALNKKLLKMKNKNVA